MKSTELRFFKDNIKLPDLVPEELQHLREYLKYETCKTKADLALRQLKLSKLIYSSDLSPQAKFRLNFLNYLEHAYKINTSKFNYSLVPSVIPERRGMTHYIYAGNCPMWSYLYTTHNYKMNTVMFETYLDYYDLIKHSRKVLTCDAIFEQLTKDLKFNCVVLKNKSDIIKFLTKLINKNCVISGCKSDIPFKNFE